MKEAEMYKVTTVTRDGKSIVQIVPAERRQMYVRAMREEYGNNVTVESVSPDEVPAIEETK
jgi:antitoxin (DNA-binding transcriptional repressor) of toxin-antitoxin stability system